MSSNPHLPRVAYEQMNKVKSAIALLQNHEHLASWQQVLIKIAEQQGLHNCNSWTQL